VALSQPLQPWSFKLGFGWYYTTTTTAATDPDQAVFGFADLNGPQIFPSATHKFSKGDSASAYVKFSPVSNGGTKLSLSNHEIAGGVSYSFKPNNGHFPTIALDIASLDLVVEGLKVTSNSTSLSVGYNF
jgi:hypothetical protein